MPKPTPDEPEDMAGILAELERLRVEALRPGRHPLPPETHALLNLLELGVQDVAAGRVEPFDEARRRLDAHLGRRPSKERPEPPGAAQN